MFSKYLAKCHGYTQAAENLLDKHTAFYHFKKKMYFVEVISLESSLGYLGIKKNMLSKAFYNVTRA